MGFKDLLRADLENVFFNTEEFAETTHVVYGKNEYDIPVVMESAQEAERASYKDDNEGAVYSVDVIAHIKASDMKVIPRATYTIYIGKDKYYIAAANNSMGEIILDLRRYAD